MATKGNAGKGNGGETVGGDSFTTKNANPPGTTTKTLPQFDGKMVGQ